MHGIIDPRKTWLVPLALNQRVGKPKGMMDVQIGLFPALDSPDIGEGAKGLDVEREDPATAEIGHHIELCTSAFGADINDPPKQQAFQFSGIVPGDRGTIAERPKLARGAVSVYRALVRVATGEERPSSLPTCGYWDVSIGYATISTLCNVSTRTVERSIAVLVSARLLVRTRGGFDCPSAYKIFVAEWLL